MRITKKKYLQFINPLEILRTKKVLQNNPTIIPEPTHQKESVLDLYQYDAEGCLLKKNINSSEITISLFASHKKYWLNLDILNKETIETIGSSIGLHPLIVEDILNKNQRPKSDEIDKQLLVPLLAAS